jgi:predicted metal-binding membrane protein
VSLLEVVLQRDRAVLVAGLVAVLAMAWGWLLTGAGMEMSVVDMTTMAGMDGWRMRPAVWTPAYAVLIFAM